MIFRVSPKVTVLTIGIIGLVLFSSGPSSASDIRNTKHDFSPFSTDSENRFKGVWYTVDPEVYFPDPADQVSEICVFCHTPHNAAGASSSTPNLLWNRISSPPTGYTYQMYSSSSQSIIDQNITAPTGISMMCMSCHDGVTSIAANVNNDPLKPTLLNAPGRGNPQIWFDPASGMNAPGALGNAYTGGGTGGWGANVGNVYPGGPSTVVDLSNDHPISFEWPTGLKGLHAGPTDGRLRLFGQNGRNVECATCHLVHDNAIKPFLAMSNENSAMCRSCHDK